MSNIPYDAQVVYLESTGTQYIDTGFKPNQDTRIVATMQCVTSTSYGRLFGCGKYNSLNSVMIDYETGITGTLHIKYGNNSSWTNVSSVHGDYAIHTYDFNKNNLYRDNELVSSNTYGAFQSTSNLGIFTYINGNNVSQSTEFFIGRLYSFQIYDNDVLVRDYIPVRVGQEGCLYDKVSGELFSNAGTGNFILGNDFLNINGFVSPFRRRLLSTYRAPLPNYLCFTALEDGTFTFTMDKDVPSTFYEYIAYSKDGGNTWIRTDNVTGTQVIATVNVIEGDEVLWKGKATNGYSTSYDRGLSKTCRFGGTAKFNVGGCIVSLIREGDFVGFENSEIVIISLFQDSKIVEADKNLLPCKAFNSYERHYENTFTNCTELISPPDLPSTKLRTASYNSTFFGCSKLVNAPELPATILSMLCYYNLFYNTKINYVKMLGKTIGGQSLINWMTNVPNVSTSIFVKHIDAAWTDTGNSGVPSNWTIIYFDPEVDKYYTDQTRATECDDHGNPI